MIGSNGMGGGGMWFRDLEAKLHSRWDLLIYLAWHRKRHPSPAEAEADAEEAATVQQQQAEARALLHR